MDEMLSRLLGARERLNSPAVSDRVVAFESLIVELPDLGRMTKHEWEVKLAYAEEDLARLHEEAVQAADRYEQGRLMLETLERLAARAADKQGYDDSTEDLRSAAETPPKLAQDSRRPTDVAKAENTREAILLVMGRRPNHRWTVQGVTEDLVRYGRRVERSNVQVTLRRLADDGKLTKDGRGAYFIVASAIPVLKGSSRHKWGDVAEQAVDAFLQAHPGEAEREALIEVALGAVETYKRNHDGNEPEEGTPVIRRLMKSRLYDHHRRIVKGDPRVQ